MEDTHNYYKLIGDLAKKLETNIVMKSDIEKLVQKMKGKTND